MERRGSDAPGETGLKATLEGVAFELVVTTARASVRIEVEDPPAAPIKEATIAVDGGPAQPLVRRGRAMAGRLAAEELGPGEHEVELHARLEDGTTERATATFRVRPPSP